MNKPTGLAAFTRKGPLPHSKPQQTRSRAPSSRQKPVSVDEGKATWLP